MKQLPSRTFWLFTFGLCCLTVLWHKGYQYQKSKDADRKGSAGLQASVTPPNYRNVSVLGLQSSIDLSGQPGLVGLTSFLDANEYDLVIRLNMEKAGTDILSLEDEREIVETDCRGFYAANIDRYFDDSSRMKQMAYIIEMIETSTSCENNSVPHVLIHCTHGVHRAATVAACWLVYRGFTFDQAIEAVGWSELAQNPGKYRKYLQTVQLFHSQISA